MRNRIILLTAIFCLIAWISHAQTTTYDIRLNQVGYLPNAIKMAALINTESDSFRIMTEDMGAVVFRGQCMPAVFYSQSGEDVSIADFSLLVTPGNYVLVADDLGKSVPFEIADQVFSGLSEASIKAFYFSRASTELLEEHAGIYARPAGHPDTAIIVHPSAASATRPAGTIISTPKGWYDAGDYNKYIVNSGISTFTLLSAYETYPEYFDTLELNIPESGNGIPDILDEALWNISWMMTMQDTADGGVYNKTTEAQFGAFTMPHQVTVPRYVVAKGTTAALDFAAIMAMTARIYKAYMPELADKALEQALDAWQWALDHPNVPFNNPAAIDEYPAISTGGYGDGNFSDEFSWCASELYITTKEPGYYEEIGLDESYNLPGWPNVKTLGLLSLLNNRDSLTAEADTSEMKEILLNLVAGAKNNIVSSPYRIPGDFFYWGGNHAYANWGMLFMHAFKITGDVSYFNAALSSLDYLLGKNATTYSFVTGAGTKFPVDIHHRPSGSDGIPGAIPGYLVGGPNPQQLTDCGAAQYPSSLAARSYVDRQCSYSTNEIAINWNAPLAFLAGAIQGEYLNHFSDSMPKYFSVSTRRINLPSREGLGAPLVFQGNTEWSVLTPDEWIDFSSDSGTGSAVIQVFSNSDNQTESTRNGRIYIYSQDLLTDSVDVSQNGLRWSFRIEAEDYLDMSGLQTEATTDAGGGQNLGYADPEDWATYYLDVSYPGIYDITFRHAGYAGDIDLYIDNEMIRNVSFEATTDWQDWESYIDNIPLTEGLHIMKLHFNAAGVNINWIDFEWKFPLVIDNVAGNNILVYPVPATDFLNVDFNEIKDRITLELYAPDGRLVYQRLFENTSYATVDIAALKKGMYLLKISFGSGSYTGRVIKN